MQGIFCEDMNKNCIGHIMAEIYRDKVYVNLMRPGMTILEVGGNVGIATLYFSEFASKIYVLEPSKSHLKCLRKTVRFNNLKNVTIIPCALDATDGKKTFHHCSFNTTMFTLKNPMWDSKTSETVDCISTTTLFDRYEIGNVDFMKMDVEGSEIDILASESFKNQAHKIKCLTVECHAWCGYLDPLRKMENTLTSLGYQWKNLARNEKEAQIYFAERIS